MLLLESQEWRENDETAFENDKTYREKICISIYVIAVSIFKSFLTLLIGKTSRFEEEPDKTIFVIGNGPSLNDTDLKVVAKSGFDIVCVNSFPERHNEFWVLKPRYLALFDPLFFVSPGEAGYEAGLFDVLEKVDWEMKVLVPQGVVLHVQNPYAKFGRAAAMGVVLFVIISVFALIQFRTSNSDITN